MGLRCFSPETLLCLTSSHRLTWAESRINCYWLCWLEFSYRGMDAIPTRRTTGTKPKSDRTSKCLSIGERSFLLFQQADSALTSLNAQRGENMLWLHHGGRLRILEPVCPLMLRDAYHCCCFWQWALISSFFPPLMLQNYPGPYQAGPSQRLECKHTAVAHRASVWALQDPTANISKRTCWFKEQTQGRLVEDLSLDYVHDFRLNHLDFMFVLIANYS